MEWFTDWTYWHWLIGGFVLLIAEVIVPGVFLLWWGLAGIVVAGLVKFLPNLSYSAQITTYAILAIVLSVIWWKYQHNRDSADAQHNSLNQRDHAMIGTLGTVQEIGENGIGRGAFGDTTWRIQGKNLAVGDVVKVVAVQGITLLVEK